MRKDTWDKLYETNPDYYDSLTIDELTLVHEDVILYDINTWLVKKVFFFMLSVCSLIIGLQYQSMDTYVSLVVVVYLISTISLLLSIRSDNLMRAKIMTYNLFIDLTS